MPGKKAYSRLKTGDHVVIPAENLAGVVVETLPHQVIVRAIVNGEVQHRRYCIELVTRESTLEEVSDFVDS